MPRLFPRRLPDPGLSARAVRSLQVTAALTRHAAPALARELAAHPRHPFGEAPAAVARPLRLACEDLGGTFIKLGQLVASAPAMFGGAVADEFRSCLDTGPPEDFDAVRLRVEEDLGRPLGDAFAEFDPDPIGRASIAVVHRARLHDGRPVAVKVLRPGIENLVAVDLALLHPLVELVVRQTGDQMAGSVLQLIDGFRVQIGEELDLRNECRSLACFRALSAGLPLPEVAVPEPYPELSGANVLTMELFDGVPIDDLAAVAELGVDPGPLVEQVVRAFFATTVRWGAFHGDVHAGNMLLLRDGRIGIIDWGIVGRLDPGTHRFFIRVLQAALGDESAWPDVARHLSDTYGPAIKEAVGLDDAGLGEFVRALIEPTLNRPFGEVSLAAVFQQAQAQIARAHGMEVHRRSVSGLAHRLRTQRRLRRMVDASGGVMSDFDRGTFLLGKQLMYFERYGRLFLSDVPILHDRSFFVELLAGVGAVAKQN